MPRSDHAVHTTLPATDLGRARAFYESTLGLTPASVNPGGVFYDCAIGLVDLSYTAAMRLGVPLASKDADLCNAAERLGVSVLRAA